MDIKSFRRSFDVQKAIMENDLLKLKKIFLCENEYFQPLNLEKTPLELAFEHKKLKSFRFLFKIMLRRNPEKTLELIKQHIDFSSKKYDPKNFAFLYEVTRLSNSRFMERAFEKCGIDENTL